MTPTDLVLTRKGLRFCGQLYPCTIGRGGVTSNKQEGDGATPVGTHTIVDVLFRPDRMRPPTPFARPIRPYHLWCDDPKHPKYNQMTRLPFQGSAEHMARPDPLYDLVLVTDWNWPKAQPGRGSAIFIHRWRRAGYPTEGCIGFRPDHLHAIATKLTSQSRLVVLPQP